MPLFLKHVLPLSVLMMLGTASFSAHVARAQVVDSASLSRREVTGTWHSVHNNRYTFRANGTYTFLTGKRASGNISHSGTWMLANHGRLLRLHATRRAVLVGKRLQTLKANKRFTFVIGTQDPVAGFYLGDEEFRPLKEKF